MISLKILILASVAYALVARYIRVEMSNPYRRILFGLSHRSTVAGGAIVVIGLTWLVSLVYFVINL